MIQTAEASIHGRGLNDTGTTYSERARCAKPRTNKDRWRTPSHRSRLSPRQALASAPVVLDIVRMSTRQRLQSIDLIRGAVMVLMVIDHVRVYSGVPPGGETAGVFFTRWVTHFCAPVFVFFAGTAAFLYAQRVGDIGAVRKFLITRGLLLVALELTVIKASWTFDLDYSQFVLAGVIWMIGWCMVLLAALVGLRPRTIGIIGLAIMGAQQLFGLIHLGFWWELIYPAAFGGDGPIVVLYTLVPWIGVMAAGYAFGAIVIREAATRDRWCLRVGLSAIAAFLGTAVLMILTTAGEPSWQSRIFQALSPSKYPAVQPFLMMTLGPAIALIPWAERARGVVARTLTLFGRVPMFFYLLHIPLIHVLALLVGRIKDEAIHPEWFNTAPYAAVPPEYRWNLPLLYLVFLVTVALLYPACRWFAGVKDRQRSPWLRFL
jgi:uncharacterized membrane protein